MQFRGTDQRFEPESVQSRVLFVKDSGAILYIHQVVTMRGAARTSDEDADARIRELAADVGITAGEVELLRVDVNELDPGGRYRVDPATRRLVRSGTRGGPAFGTRAEQ